MNLTIEKNDQATPFLNRARAVMKNQRPINQAMASGAIVLVQDKFRGLASTNRNPYGARGGFWNRMLSGTKAMADAQFAILRMPREVALRFHGGTVRPKTTKFLAIPARKEAYGKSPRDFNDLRFAVLPVGGPVLIQAAQTQITFNKARRVRRGGKEIGGGVFFWLRRSVTVRGDAGVLPTKQELLDAAGQAGERFIIGRLTQ